MVACLSGGGEHKPLVQESHAAAQCDAGHVFAPNQMRHNRRMTQVSQSALEIIEWVDEIDSTNSELLRRAAAGVARAPQALVAARQTQGRGRAGRRWISPGPAQQAENLCLSMLIDVAVPISELAPLTLALGVAARRVLPQVQLKWPNDLFLAGKKLGGILVEVAKSSPGCCTVVVGIGVNLRMPQTIDIDQQYTDLAGHGLFTSARDLAPLIVARFRHAATDYASNRLINFADEWRAADTLVGQKLIVSDDPATLWCGLGISAVGGYKVGFGDRVRELVAGEIRVRTTA